jgi:hypothetical protein
LMKSCSHGTTVCIVSINICNNKLSLLKMQLELHF